MNYTIPPSLAVIQDMAGIGRCSLSVALPIISACKVQACPLPTAIFSNHTGYPVFYKKDLNDCISDYLTAWTQLNKHFDGIYCGYLGNITQMHTISSFIKDEKAKNPDTRVIIDPVMGDHGCIYKNLPDDYAFSMKDFLQTADLITPNITEACILTDTPFRENDWDSGSLWLLCEKLHKLGPKQVIITGIQENDCFHNFISDSVLQKVDSYQIPISGSSRPGTGDIFTSIVAALLLSGLPLTKCVKTAADFIAVCTKASDEAGVPVCDGVIFENFLSILTD